MNVSPVASSDKVQSALTNLGIPDGFVANDVVPLLQQLVVALGNVTGGGGGGNTTSTVTQTSIPDWLKPQTEAMLGSATQQIFGATPVTDSKGNTTYNINGVNPYIPYSTNPQDYYAGFSPMQQQSFAQAAKDRKSTRLNSSHSQQSRMPSSA